MELEPLSLAPLSPQAQRGAKDRAEDLLMPFRALGRAHDLVEQLAGIQGREFPSGERIGLFLACGDHGVVAQGVTRYPQEITAFMVKVFLRGGAAVNALARGVGATVAVVNAGVAQPIEGEPTSAEVVLFVNEPVRAGTGDFTREPAMGDEEVKRAIELGRRSAHRFIERYHLDLLCLGEMGIGNTTTSSALTSALLNLPPEKVVGPGADLPPERIPHKVAVVEKALAFHRDRIRDPLGLLASLGGLEIATLVGAVMAGGERGVPLVADGFISTTAVAIALRLEPRLKDYILFSHVSPEPGHRYLLGSLSARPLLDLGMRLGEGTGALMASALIRLFCRLHREMESFSGLGISRG
jgi:nicotinate-nucleotide--dimethylbenzimidazole phosphoribosyltransferase